MNMKRWIHPDSVRKFMRLRDSDEYTCCLQALPKHIDKSKFLQSRDTEELEQIGYDLGVFRAYVLENLFMPTFQWLDQTPPTPVLPTSSPDSLDSFRSRWREWPIKKIRLSRGGTITVKLERQVQNEPLVSLAEKVLGLEHLEPYKIVHELEKAIEQGNGAQIELLSDRLRRGVHKVWGIQGQIARELVRQFLRAIVNDPTYSDKAYQQVLLDHPRLAEKFSVQPQALVWHNPQNPSQDFFLNTTEPADEETHPLRDRYVIFAFSKFAEAATPDVSLSPEQIQDNPCHCRSVASLLEGVILGQTGKNPSFAKFKERMAREYVRDWDLATWQNELCALTLDNGLVYYYSDHAFPTTQEISFPDRQVKHEQYWGSIIRGIEHLMDVRVQAQMMAGETAERLVEAAEFTRQARHPKMELAFDAEQQQLDETIQRFAVNVSHLSRMVAHLRNSSSATALAKADYAVTKFQHWLETSQIDRTLQYADTNLHDMNAFLSHYDNIRLGQESLRLSRSIESLQHDSQSTNDMTLLMTAMFSGIMTVLSYLSLPSFTADLARREDIKTIFSFLDPSEIRVILGWFGVAIFFVSFIVTAILLFAAVIRIRAGLKARGRSLLRQKPVE
jgi:hypothetical protein